MVARHRIVLLVIALAAAACGTGGDPASSQTRTVLVDYNHDEFATTFLEYFPRRVTVRPGDSVVFRQTWTGEPHSVTLGRAVQRLGEVIKPYLELAYEGGWAALPPEEPPDVVEAGEGLPMMFADEENGAFHVAQNAAQPCFLDEGLPPEDPDTPCAPEDREQPAFNGRQNYYNSGFIPYEGPGGNTFTMPIAEDTDPGEYFYYCNLHGPLQAGWIEVAPKGTQIPSQTDVNRQAREQIEEVVAPFREVYEKAAEGEWEPPEESIENLRALGLARARGERTYLTTPLSGLEVMDETVWAYGAIMEFVPRDLRVKAGEPIRWLMFSGHTVSFNVPPYLPIFEIDSDGTVRRNERVDLPAGGAPDPPAPPEEGPPPEDGEEAERRGPEEITVIDAGRWDGQGFWSSGMVDIWPMSVYELTITRPGTYRYACLVHPPMVGTLTVTA